jgi:Mn2+/Fe2+ NRAMP family transporter
VLPQLVVAVATIAGLAGSAATALVLALPGDARVWTVASIAVSTLLVLAGKYRGVELVAMALAVALALASITAALSVLPDAGAIASGVVPRLPSDMDYREVLPWLGFMLSGAAGMIWYSYWAQAKRYGAAAGADQPPLVDDAQSLTVDERARLRGWLSQMTLDNSVAVGGTLLITLAFLVLGAELLRPQGLIPEEDRVAEVLGELLGGVWGEAGFWFMVLAVFVGFWDTVLSNQDGFGRMFADGARRLSRIAGRPVPLTQEQLRDVIVLAVLTVAPIALYLVAGAPVHLLQLAGAIEAAHIPVVAALTLYLNQRALPPDLRASMPVTVVTGAAALFFAAFALMYVFTF